MSSTLGSDVSTSQVGLVRCNVILPNGASVRVPIQESAKIVELHRAAILRASGIIRDFQHSVDTTALKLGGRDAAYLWKDDSICEVVGDPENNTFILTPLEEASCTSPNTQSPPQGSEYGDMLSSYQDCAPSSYDVIDLPSNSSDSDEIKIRWVFPETAIAIGRSIKAIPADHDTLPSTMTVAALEQLALGKLLTLRASIGQLPAGVTPTMFTEHCEISHTTNKNITIATLGLTKTNTEPLTIFLVPTRNSASSIRDALGFKTSDRAFATFMTSLRLFITNIGNDRRKLDNFIAVIWELTHFPPAAIAIRQMVHDTDILPQPCTVFAACFRELCLQIAPPKFYGFQDDVLLTSRHVFSWLSTLRSHYSITSKTTQPLVHIVELRKSDNLSKLGESGKITYEESVDLPEPQSEAQASCQSNSDQGKQKLVVCKERVDNISNRMLGLTLNEGSDAVIRYYFDLPADLGTFAKHKRRALMDRSCFVKLLQTIHQDEVFRMVGPFQLSQCPSMSLPVVTLDSSGLVSLYDQKTPHCAERYSFTSNIIKPEEQLPATEPGHYLLQKLDPLIIERKKAGTWQLEAWEEAKPGSFGGPPYEAVVVCVDTSSSMNEAMPSNWFESQEAANNVGNQLSRFNEAKEFFQNFIVRLNAYRVSTDVGLVTFSYPTQVRTHLPLTRVILGFKDSIANINAKGNTALWDGVQKGCGMLVEHKLKYPDAKLRIVVLTDGYNNSSVSTPENVCAALYKHNITLDAIVIGTDATEDLFKFAKHTGGYAFHPQNRTALFQIFLLENFVDIKTRPAITKEPIDDYRTSVPKIADLKTMFDCPPCLPHENQNDHFIALADAENLLRRVTRPAISQISRASYAGPPASVSSRSSSTVSGATRILLDQIQAAISRRHPYVDIYVSEKNMGFWKMVMEGRPGTPYAKGVFLAYLEIGEDFPDKPPTMRFITPILHPNVSKHGRICHQIFDRSWNSEFSAMQVIQHVWDILVLVESEDAIDPISAVRFYTDQASAQKLISQYIDRFALKSRAQHRLEICGSENPSTANHSSRASSVISFSDTFSSSQGGNGITSPRPQPPWRR